MATRVGGWMEPALLRALRDHGSSLIEELVVHTRLTSNQVRRTLAALQRQGFAAEVGEGRYSLTPDGLKASSATVPPPPVRDRINALIYLVDDTHDSHAAHHDSHVAEDDSHAVEDDSHAVDASTEEAINIALDHELGVHEDDS